MSKGTHLGELEQMVLLAVLQLKEEAFGISVMNELRERGSREVSRGALYVTLDRLEAKGFLDSRLGDPIPGRGGRPRRYLSVTEAGIEALQESRATLARMWEGLDAVFEKR